MKTWICFLLFAAVPTTAQAELYFDPHFAVGFNSAQGTHFMLGADLGAEVTEQVNMGLGVYYSAGEEPPHDREIGVGPFLSYSQPVAEDFIMLHVREELNYVNLYDPRVNAAGDVVDHDQESGIASATSAGLHIFFTPNLVLSGGYRLVIGLTNEALDDGRSGAFFGVTLGI